MRGASERETRWEGRAISLFCITHLILLIYFLSVGFLHYHYWDGGSADLPGAAANPIVPTFLSGVGVAVGIGFAVAIVAAILILRSAGRTRFIRWITGRQIAAFVLVVPIPICILLLRHLFESSGIGNYGSSLVEWQVYRSVGVQIHTLGFLSVSIAVVLLLRSLVRRRETAGPAEPPEEPGSRPGGWIWIGTAVAGGAAVGLAMPEAPSHSLLEYWEYPDPWGALVRTDLGLRWIGAALLLWILAGILAGRWSSQPAAIRFRVGAGLILVLFLLWGIFPYEDVFFGKWAGRPLWSQGERIAGTILFIILLTGVGRAALDRFVPRIGLATENLVLVVIAASSLGWQVRGVYWLRWIGPALLLWVLAGLLAGRWRRSQSVAIRFWVGGALIWVLLLLGGFFPDVFFGNEEWQNWVWNEWVAATILITTLLTGAGLAALSPRRFIPRIGLAAESLLLVAMAAYSLGWRDQEPYLGDFFAPQYVVVPVLSIISLLVFACFAVDGFRHFRSEGRDVRPPGTLSAIPGVPDALLLAILLASLHGYLLFRFPSRHQEFRDVVLPALKTTGALLLLIAALRLKFLPVMIVKALRRRWHRSPGGSTSLRE